MKRMGVTAPKNCPLLAWAMTSRTSFTPLVTALRVKKGAFNCAATILAKVVLPTPGGPHKMKDEMRPPAIMLRNTAPGPTKCCCPT